MAGVLTGLIPGVQAKAVQGPWRAALSIYISTRTKGPLRYF
jgi:hypothetical protein